LLKALCFPLRKPSRLLSLALMQSVLLWLLFSVIDLSEDHPFDWGALVVTLLLVLVLFVNVNWMHNYLASSLRCTYSGRMSLPRLAFCHFHVIGFRPAVSSVVLSVYFLLFLAVTQMLPFPLQDYHFAPGGMSLGEALNRLAADVIAVLLVVSITLIYFVGLARFAAEGRSPAFAALKANLRMLLNNKRATLRRVLRQLVIMGIAALVFYFGAEVVYEIWPSGLDDPTEGLHAAITMAVALFVALCVLLYFWYASAHLVAQYAIKIGLAPPQHKRSS